MGFELNDREKVQACIRTAAWPCHPSPDQLWCPPALWRTLASAASPWWDLWWDSWWDSWWDPCGFRGTFVGGVVGGMCGGIRSVRVGDQGFSQGEHTVTRTPSHACLCTDAITTHAVASKHTLRVPCVPCVPRVPSVPCMPCVPCMHATAYALALGATQSLCAAGVEVISSSSYRGTGSPTTSR